MEFFRFVASVLAGSVVTTAILACAVKGVHTLQTRAAIAKSAAR